MRDDDKILLYFLFCFINKKKPDEHIDIHWRNLYRLSSLHDVSAIVYSLIKQLSIEKQPDNEILEKFRADYDYAIIRSTNQEFEMQGLIDQFVTKGIYHIMFKGYCIKHYYPLPELRTMGDIDFLVHLEDRKKVVKTLIENGFQAESEIGDVWSYRKNKIVLELHTQMASGHYWNGYDYETYFSCPFSHVEFSLKTYSARLDKNYHLLFLFFHLAKHLSSTGAGIRMIMDIAVYVKELGNCLDWGWIKNELKRIQLETFSIHVLMLCKEWFGVEIEDATVKMDSMLFNQTERFIIAGGVFGCASRDCGEVILRNSMYGKKIKNEQMHLFKTVIHYLFPSLRKMRSSSIILRNYPFLLPLAWTKRLWRGLRKRKQVFKVIKSIRASMEQAQEENELIKRIGL